MEKIRFKNKTAGLIDVMIRQADKGPSGFWTEDHEGCGNPEIFPEFREGLSHGTLTYKKHYVCPWNTAILLGDGHGDIRTGCFHSCSFLFAKYLPTDMLRTVLMRFRQKLVSGEYDDLSHIKPLLTDEECAYIENQLRIENEKYLRDTKEKYAEKKKRAESLLKKFQDDENLQEILAANYGDDTQIMTEYGCVNFSPSGIQEISGGEKLTYDEYLEIQAKSAADYRGWFETCYHEYPMGFAGQIERITDSRVCFKAVYVSGMYTDGTMFDGKEDHVWMDKTGFEEFSVGDCVSFSAQVYWYLKTGNGKRLDYGLKDPGNIIKIESYDLPSDDELIMQEADSILCESCFMADQCRGRDFCIMDPEQRKQMKQRLFEEIRQRYRESEEREGSDE